MSRHQLKFIRLGIFLKANRERQGLTQLQVAESLGRTVLQSVSNWERGLRSPPLATLRKLAFIYAIDLDELFEILLEIKIQEIKEEHYAALDKLDTVLGA